MSLEPVLLLLAAICFGLAFLNVQVHRKREFNLVALGLLLAILIPLIDEIEALF